MENEYKVKFKIDKGMPVPLYYQLKAQFLRAFDEGLYQPGDKLPTEAELCDWLDISRPTVRQAFSELIAEGHITRLKAKGTFVAQPKVEGYFFQKLESFDEEMKSLGLQPTTKVLLAEIIPATMEMKARFTCESVFHMKRIRYADDVEMVLVDTYVPYVKVPGIEKVDFNTVSLYYVLKDKYHVGIEYVDRVVEAKHADKETCNLLKMQEGDAILYAVTTAFTLNEQPIEYSIARYHGEHNKFKMRLTR